MEVATRDELAEPSVCVFIPSPILTITIEQISRHVTFRPLRPDPARPASG